MEGKPSNEKKNKIHHQMCNRLLEHRSLSEPSLSPEEHQTPPQ